VLVAEDDPAFLQMHDASARIAAGSLDVARAVWRGETEHGVNFCGGLHHAMPDRASGFCIYNDIAVAIQWLLDNGAKRVAYVDVDVHHGDGVERIFWDDPRVLTISSHESGRVLFPGTGFPGDTGGPGAPQSAANVVGVTRGTDLVLYLFGTPGQDRFDFMWEILGEGMIGYLLLIDANHEDSLEQAVAIHGAFRKMARVPYVVALNRASADDHSLVETVRNRLDIPGDIAILACDATDKESVKNVLLALLYAVLDEVETQALRV